MKHAVSFLFIISALASTNRAETLTIENQALRVELAPDTGLLRVVEKAGGFTWEQAPSKPQTNAIYRALGRKDAAMDVEQTADVGKGAKIAVRLRFSLPDPNAAELRVEATVDDPKTPIGEIRFLEPFVLDARRGVLAVADYSNGHLYPLDTDPFPRRSFSGDRLDLPLVALCDLDSGRGYLLLL